MSQHLTWYFQDWSRTLRWIRLWEPNSGAYGPQVKFKLHCSHGKLRCCLDLSLPLFLHEKTVSWCWRWQITVKPELLTHRIRQLILRSMNTVVNHLVNYRAEAILVLVEVNWRWDNCWHYSWGDQWWLRLEVYLLQVLRIVNFTLWSKVFLVFVLFIQKVTIGGDRLKA